MKQPQQNISELLDRGTIDVIDRANLERRLRNGEKLRVKLGIDPSGTELHLGHAVVLRKLKQFQLAGHTIVLIIGDWTARIGDPSGRKETRPQLTPAQVAANAKKYLKQLALVLDIDRIEVRYQSEWFDAFTLQTIIELAAKFTVQQLLQRDDFKERMNTGVDVRYHEPMYCLLQGYDSVAVRADLELGGNDQLFNLLKGREVQVMFGQSPQDVLTVPLLVGLDGAQKMGKSLNNYIALDEPPREMYGKVMSLPDSLIVPYFTLATDEPFLEIKKITNSLQDKETNPRDVKSRLARTIVSLYHSGAAARTAEAEFIKVFRAHTLPEEIPVATVSAVVWRPDILLVELKLASSRGEAQRLILQGGVKIAGKIVANWKSEVKLTDGDVIQVGKRKFVRVLLQP